MSQSKRQFNPNQKVSILRDHLLDQTPISDVCDQHGIRPTLFYRWQKEFFENGATVFTNKKNSVEQELREENCRLKAKLQNKNEVVAELMEDYVQLKKKLGEL